MIDTRQKARDRTRAGNLMARFEAAGAIPVETALLQPADILLDLYGEDIRGRAYVTSDPLRGEMMLRPDFTVPVTRMHMAHGANPARYTYAGEVFRKQEHDDARPIEYLQTGIELFGAENSADADAEVFALIAEALEGQPVQAITGDMGLLRAAISGLSTSPARKAALLRHIWRPRRFRRLLDKFRGKAPLPAGRAALLADPDPLAGIAALPGRRTRAEIETRLDALRCDAAEPPLSTHQAEILDAVVKLRENAHNVIAALRDLAVDMPALEQAAEVMEDRLEALEKRGIATAHLRFDAGFGRASMEYYDGFVFAFQRDGRPDLPPVATGGRYDALTAVLGQGTGIPAVGAVIRPELMEEAQ